MADAKFTHLHVHTHYSLLDGANKIPDLVRQAKKLGMDSLAITDHGCMFGVVEFFNECKKEGIKPILGMEAYMAPGDRREKSGTPGETAYHLLLLAQNLEGYHNLLKLSSTAYRDGFYYKPRIDKDVLREHHRGIIATSACLGGEIPSAFMRRGKMAEAKATVETYLDIFGPDRFFIEVQNHIKEQNEVNPELAELARKTGVGLVATNDVHFLTADDHRVHDVLCCISMGKLQSDESRLKYPKELFLKSPAEMVTALGDFDQAVENTTRIAAMCDLSLDFSKRYAPVYKVEPAKLDDRVIPPGLPAATLTPVPAGEPVPVMKDDERYMRQLCEVGLDWRYGTRDVPKAVRDRLEYEITIIAAKSFCSYFLIVWDFCNYARDNGIPVGARGSGVGSMVAFLLGLCNVDPLTYNLLFERFMDPSRNEMPDIDIDICQDGRQRVIEYVRQKYGHVAQIITFGTLAAKAACKDVGRVLGVPLAEIDRLTKLIPPTPGMTLKKAIDAVPELDRLIKESPAVAQVIDYAKKLEGMARNAGCHAAGVIIADQPLDGIVPLYRDSDGNVLTQFEGPIAEKCGLLKMDFLGLRTLTSLTRSVDLEFETRDKRPVKWAPGQPVPAFDPQGRFEIDKVDLSDPAVYRLFQRGETRGVFQFESGGMQDLLIKMVPDRIGDLIAANALYRPGPMELIPTYCARKHGKEAVPRVHPIMDGILEETYGIMVYQEQVMQIFNQLGGIDLSNAYKLIKAISKKNGEIIAKFKPDFLRGTMEKGVAKEKAEEIFDFILKFGGYGFNKSHSARYAIVAYQTAYMKTYHPVEYMSAVLTFEMGTTEKVVEYIDECRRMTLVDGTRGIKVLPPDVNVSAKDFTPVYTTVEEKKVGRGKPKSRVEGVIRFGLAAVRGVGEKAVEGIAAERAAKGDFANLYDFCERVDLRAVTRSTIEALAKCGAFASTGAKPGAADAGGRPGGGDGPADPGRPPQRPAEHVRRPRRPGRADGRRAHGRQPAGGGRVRECRAAQVREGAARVLHHQPPVDRPADHHRAVHHRQHQGGDGDARGDGGDDRRDDQPGGQEGRQERPQRRHAVGHHHRRGPGRDDRRHGVRRGVRRDHGQVPRRDGRGQDRVRPRQGRQEAGDAEPDGERDHPRRRRRGQADDGRVRQARLGPARRDRPDRRAGHAGPPQGDGPGLLPGDDDAGQGHAVGRQAARRAAVAGPG